MITIPDFRSLTPIQIVIGIGAGVAALVVLNVIIDRGGPRSRSGAGWVWVVVPLLVIAAAGIVWVLVKVLRMMGSSFMT